MADRIGQQLGNYQLISLLGEGGFAEVYLGEHIHLGTQAAIKVLHNQLTSDDVLRFRTEARTIARLIHPHIVRVLEFGVEGKTPFLVMDLAPNGTLRQRYPKGVVLPLPFVVAYVKQVADALQYAHDEKLIHRDIKPANMLLGRHNEILLSDFGIALVAQSSRYQSAQEMAGTMGYMAPEQIQGKPRPASDQYSLGIVVYEWLSGDRPFHGSLIELVGQHLSMPPPSLHDKVPAISPAIEQVVLIALAKNPKERFASMQAFAIALEQACQTGFSPIAQPSNIISPSQSLPLGNTVAAGMPNHVQESTNIITPPSQSLRTTNKVTPPNQLLKPLGATTPPFTSQSAKTHSTGQAEEFLSVANSREIEKTASIQQPGRDQAIIHHRPGLPKIRSFLLIGLILLVIAGSIGLYSVMRTNQITIDNARATAYVTTGTAQANATSNAFATATSIVLNRDPYPPYTGQLVLNDPLKDNSKGYNWQEITSTSGSCVFEGGAYHAIAASTYLQLCFTKATDFSNFIFEVQMTIIKGITGEIIIRADSTKEIFYAVAVGYHGQIGGYSFIPYGDNNAKPKSGDDPVFQAGLGKSNLIAVIAIDNIFKLYVNHVYITSWSASAFSHGQIGVDASPDTGPAEVAFSNAKVWRL